MHGTPMTGSAAGGAASPWHDLRESQPRAITLDEAVWARRGELVRSPTRHSVLPAAARLRLAARDARRAFARLAAPATRRRETRSIEVRDVRRVV